MSHFLPPLTPFPHARHGQFTSPSFNQPVHFFRSNVNSRIGSETLHFSMSRNCSRGGLEIKRSF
jgi:hypothetical protein